MSEKRYHEARTEGIDLQELMGAIYSQAYFEHMHKTQHIVLFEGVELTSVRVAGTDDQYIVGRPQLDSSGNRGISFWIYEYVPGVPLQNYTTAELSLVVREEDPSQFYILSEGEFAAYGTDNSRHMTGVLLRSEPVPLH
jgi:hypothetical protein